MRIPDRWKLRREYLAKKTGVRSKIVGSQLVFVLLMAVTILSGLACFTLLLFSIGFAPELFPATLITALLTAGGGYLSHKMTVFTARAEQEEKALAFVPP